MTVYLKRMASFSAAHNYWLPSLSQVDNRKRFGRWAGQEGHGHNYRVQVSVAGEIDQQTGMVVNITDVNLALKRRVTDILDGKFLNREVDFFTRNPPTVENIAGWIFSSLSPHLPAASVLNDVTLWENDTLCANVGLDNSRNMVTRLTRSYDFSASHRLHSKYLSDEDNLRIFGKCNNPHGHGHNYGVEVTLAGAPNADTGMICSIDDIDRIVEEEVLLPFDHKHLNLDTVEFSDVNPTSEMLAVVIWQKLAKRINGDGGFNLYSVVVVETARNSFEYRGD
jgi:6-pyruvoyltetrahydropterin/6-carboxytetrahydropterin synthase